MVLKKIPPLLDIGRSRIQTRHECTQHSYKGSEEHNKSLFPCSCPFNRTFLPFWHTFGCWGGSHWCWQSWKFQSSQSGQSGIEDMCLGAWEKKLKVTHFLLLFFALPVCIAALNLWDLDVPPPGRSSVREGKGKCGGVSGGGTNVHVDCTSKSTEIILTHILNYCEKHTVLARVFTTDGWDVLVCVCLNKEKGIDYIFNKITQLHISSYAGFIVGSEGWNFTERKDSLQTNFQACAVNAKS